MKNIAIITARSGSKGLKDKNIKLLNNKPLLAYSIEAAMNANVFDEIMVSTDSEEYAAISKKYGANVPFLRSACNSNDYAGSWDVVVEVLEKYRQEGKEYDTVCLLQPTSPLRTADDICNGYRSMEEKQCDSIVAVCETEHSPLWMNVLPSSMNMKNFIDAKIADKRRQELPTYYQINGALYIKKIVYLEKVVLQEKTEYAIIMDREKSIDIDTDIDFKVAEIIIGK